MLISCAQLWKAYSWKGSGVKYRRSGVRFKRSRGKFKRVMCAVRKVLNVVPKVMSEIRVRKSFEKYKNVCVMSNFERTLIRVACQPTLKEWLVGILIPTDVGL